MIPADFDLLILIEWRTGSQLQKLCETTNKPAHALLDHLESMQRRGLADFVVMTGRWIVTERGEQAIYKHTESPQKPRGKTYGQLADEWLGKNPDATALELFKAIGCTRKHAKNLLIKWQAARMETA